MLRLWVETPGLNLVEPGFSLRGLR